MGIGVWLAGVALSVGLRAQEPFSGSLDPVFGWRSTISDVDSTFGVTVDGNVIHPPRMRQPDNASPPKDTKPGRTTLETEVNKLAVVHETQFDKKRNGQRIFDVVTNKDSKERRVRVEFNSMMRSTSKVKYNGFLTDGGDVLENGAVVPEKTHAIVLLAELPDSPAVPLFVWGDRDAPWPVRIREVGSSVRLSYEGVLQPGEMVSFIHWTATVGLDKTIKLERTFDLFLKKGKLIDPLLLREQFARVGNFKLGSLDDSVIPEVAEGTVKLVALDKLCEKLGIGRGDKDILWMSKDEVFKGMVAAEKISFSAGGRTVEIDWKDVAAIRGGGGRGREHRLYLRNGSVWDGRVKFPGTKLTGDIGSMTLDGDALELLVGQRQPDDGKLMDGVQGFVQTFNGRHFWIRENGAFAAKLVSHFGVLPLESDEVWMVRRKTEQPYDQTVTLMDGSRIQGVLADTLMTVETAGMEAQTFSVSELSRWGKREAWFEEVATDGAEKAKAAPPSRYCWLRDGSFLVGTLTDAPLILRTRQEDVTIKSQEIKRLAPLENDSAQFTVEFVNGTKIKGRFVQDSVSWQLGKQVVALPVGLITELVRKDQP